MRRFWNTPISLLRRRLLDGFEVLDLLEVMKTLDRGNLEGSDCYRETSRLRTSTTPLKGKVVYSLGRSVAGVGEVIGDWGTLEGDSLFQKRKRSMYSKGVL